MFRFYNKVKSETKYLHLFPFSRSFVERKRIGILSVNLMVEIFSGINNKKPWNLPADLSFNMSETKTSKETHKKNNEEDPIEIPTCRMQKIHSTERRIVGNQISN